MRDLISFRIAQFDDDKSFKNLIKEQLNEELESF